MAVIRVVDDLAAIAAAAAEYTYQSLREAINAHGQVTWVLAGGRPPVAAFQVLAEHYAHRINWQKVHILMGDERCVPLDHADSNWLQASSGLLDKIAIPPANLLAPPMELSAEAAAKHYQEDLSHLPHKQPGIPHLDCLWLGIGEDGHTLSLFPGNPTLADTRSLVVAVHSAPKPPPDRISLTLRSLSGVSSCLIMASGDGKAEIVARALAGEQALPIAQAIATIEAAGGLVTWLLDKAAARNVNS